MKVLVVGATGFIGSAVVRCLLEGKYSVRVLARDKTNTQLIDGLDVDIIEGNTANLNEVKQAVEGCSAVIHLASEYSFLPFWKKRESGFYENNVQGTINVLSAALSAKVQRLVYTSSIAAVGKRNDGKASDENTTFSMDSAGHYGRSKYLAEQEVYKFVERGLPAVILNPGIVLGPGDRKPTPSGEIIVKFLRRQYPCYFDTVWALADVNDVARAHVTALERGRIGQRYILCNREHYTMKEIFGLLEKISGVKSPKLKLPYCVLTAYVYADEWIASLFGKKPLIASEALQFCKSSVRFDNSLAVRELEYQSAPIEQTLAGAVDWFKSQGYVN